MAELLLKVCDVCAKQSQRIEATATIRLTLDDEPLRIDVCERHEQELKTQLAKLRAISWPDERVAQTSSINGSRGRKSSESLLSSSESRGCPVCFRLFSSRSNTRAHIRKMHNRDPDDFSDDAMDLATARARDLLKVDAQ